MTGKFISFEGPEGSGKSTHIAKLADRLRRRNISVCLTREPGGTPSGEIIRGLLQHDTAGEPLAPRAEVLLFCASRAQLVERVIRPALRRGHWVLCDRFTDSTLAYQGFGRGFPLSTLQFLNAFACENLKPDLTLLLDVEPGEGHNRLKARHQSSRTGPDRIERETEQFHARLRSGFLELAAKEPNRFCLFKTGRSVAEVADEIWSAVASRFELPMDKTAHAN